jgi:hypothetical protein
MKLGTEKPGITALWFPVWYTLCPHKGISSGDGKCCSERELASSNVKGVFLADGSAKSLRHFLYSPQRTLPVIQTVVARFGVLWNRRVMSSQFHLEQAEEGTWRRKAMLTSEDLARTLSHKWLESGWGGSLEGVPMQSDQ